MRKSIYPEVASTIGAKIRKKRMDSKLTLADIANKAGITMSYLSRIEADLLIPKPDTLENIVTALQDDISTYIPFLLKKYFREDSPIHRFNDRANKMILQNNDVILKNNDITKMIKHRINKTEEVVENFDKSIEDMKNLLLRLPTDETSRNILITSQKSESVTAKLKTELTELKSEYAKLESVMAQLESENAKLIETSNFMNDIKERARKKKEK